MYWLLKVLCGRLLLAWFPVKVSGTETLPRQGPCIVAINHQSFIDSLIIPAALPRRVTYPAKREYFVKPGIKGALQRWFFEGVGQIPIDRTGGEAATTALDAGMEVLRAGGVFGIYPEGTRSPDGRLYRGKTGVARLAMATGAPIYPIAVTGTRAAQPEGSTLPRRSPVTVTVGKPVLCPPGDPSVRDEATHQALRQCTDEVMNQLATMLGQVVQPEYGSEAKARLRGQ
ncbi:1-acyl-sn-glycerol-3-phosphate acyltransferase 1, chloroplastic [Platysternon megacephalum]|uniref:1-acylglycerol-3-phosphate O-acyltransferase n=1 Tax=Platysternon megacephalum TaxID=55544 RepID=A0A4D9DG34_9SAUR|nr:1-acyl-sn-glycerol-3-phosphate acyltransferase 1, chloroplastic [Platysternon megacephalum]